VTERGEHDDELEAAVEAEYQKGVETYRWSLGTGMTVFPASREAIRKRLKRERREEQEARLRELQLAEAERRAAERQRGRKTTPGSDPAPYPYVQLERAFEYLANGKSQRWLETQGIISRHRLREAIRRGVRWDRRDRLVLPPGTQTTPAGDVILPRL
jgi:hypothetical protein